MTAFKLDRDPRSRGRRIALVWTVVGLGLLLNVAAHAVLSAPGLLNFVHGEVPNTALGTFPYTFIPEFITPLAMMLHVLAFRALRTRSSAASAGFEAPGVVASCSPLS